MTPVAGRARRAAGSVVIVGRFFSSLSTASVCTAGSRPLLAASQPLGHGRTPASERAKRELRLSTKGFPRPCTLLSAIVPPDVGGSTRRLLTSSSRAALWHHASSWLTLTDLVVQSSPFKSQPVPLSLFLAPSTPSWCTSAAPLHPLSWTVGPVVSARFHGWSRTRTGRPADISHLLVSLLRPRLSTLSLVEKKKNFDRPPSIDGRADVPSR